MVYMWPKSGYLDDIGQEEQLGRFNNLSMGAAGLTRNLGTTAH